MNKSILQSCPLCSHEHDFSNEVIGKDKWREWRKNLGYAIHKFREELTKPEIKSLKSLIKDIEGYK